MKKRKTILSGTLNRSGYPLRQSISNSNCCVIGLFHVNAVRVNYYIKNYLNDVGCSTWCQVNEVLCLFQVITAGVYDHIKNDVDPSSESV